ncbi:MAG: acetaldehyde dehydrogenase (acetylating) [Desulfovibrio sp.]|uniref:acetaldehyde dehydrogenase (acetylating) n=1 Tax=Desulfovibrio sp. TaxID=885 RepID=UPI0025839CEB|nr:acetaldehyde dehydrogenase (acetylating) [Desulfovibrio sp.]MCD7984419.1 acetaldehyde dehydrogenase (acetylating) [Desulfovibrio sp.]
MSQDKIGAAIVGPGNIGIDLIYKMATRAQNIELKLVCGNHDSSKGLDFARKLGFEASANSIADILLRDDIKIVFDATTAAAHTAHAPLLEKAGKFAVDLTPAAVGPYCCPAIALDDEHLAARNVNLITCGGQATIPMVKAVSRVTPVGYGEIVAVIASKSAGPGTRQSIDEFTRTTAKGIVEVGGAATGKAIILLNPAEPPMNMSNTIYLMIDDFREKELQESVEEMVHAVQQYVPGYRLKIPPNYDGERLMIMVEVEGSGDYLPTYAGNLDIETCAALAVGERVADLMMSGHKF